MDKLHMQLVVQGIHGRTGQEVHTPQRFQIDVDAALDFSRAFRTDKLQDTVDYCEIEKKIRDTVGKESHVLIETLAHRIAERVMEHDFVYAVTVGITKLDVFCGGRPSVSLTRDRYALDLGLLDIDGTALFRELIHHGGASVPILPEPRRVALFTEAKKHMYIEQPEYTGSHRVREQVSSSSMFPYQSPFLKLRDDLQILLHLRFPRVGETAWRGTPFDFTDIVLQRYQQGSSGVTPHVEGKSVVNIFCVVILTGDGKTAVCADRTGRNSRYLDTTPGNVLIFRAPGFMGSHLQQFHFLTDITSERITFCLRQKQK